MPDLIKILEPFNRKERFFLVGAALGNAKFKLSEDYLEALGEATCVKIPENAFAAMDYHLDWLHASLFTWDYDDPEDEGPFCNDIGVSTGNQQDIDLLIAFKAKEYYHLILVEAKAYSSWDNQQLESKAKRLRKIFGNDGNKYPNVKPHFFLTSPRCPQNLKMDKWPSWMTNNGKVNWLKLCVPEERRTVIGWDANEEKPSKKRCRFKVRKQSYFKRNN